MTTRPTGDVQRVACVIPALDAATTIGDIVDGLRAALPEALVVGVDDGSTDATASIMIERCDRVIRHPRNLGKGTALRAGFDEALSMGATTIVSIDADGQHDPQYAPMLIAALEAADVVVGSRQRTRTRMPWRRRVTNALSVAAASRLVGCPIPDPQSGFRALRAPVLRTIRARGARYEFETDFLLRAARAGYRIASVPVPTIYGPASHFREVRDGCLVVATFWRHAWSPQE